MRPSPLRLQDLTVSSTAIECFGLLRAGPKIKAPTVNPDEMETQLPPGLIPRAPPPEHIATVLAEIMLNPPSVDHTLQYKQQFKALVSGNCASRPDEKVAGTSGVLITPMCLLHAPHSHNPSPYACRMWVRR